MAVPFDIFEDSILSLRKCATTEVVVDGDKSRTGSAISVSRLKMNEMISHYSTIYQLVNKCWSNFPDPPCNERTYIFMWVLSADDYCVNHGTISWEGSTLNTFIHLWSVIDRIKPTLQSMDMGWIVGSRSCTDYCKWSGMSGPLDHHMYRRELVTPEAILSIENEPIPLTFESDVIDFCSYHDFNETIRMTVNE